MFLWSWEKLKNQFILLLDLTKNTHEFFGTGDYFLQIKLIKGKRTVIQVIQSSGAVLGFCRSGCKYQVRERELKKSVRQNFLAVVPARNGIGDRCALWAISPVWGGLRWGHSSVQQPYGQSFAVGTGNTLLQWMGQLPAKKKVKKGGFSNKP